MVPGTKHLPLFSLDTWGSRGSRVKFQPGAPPVGSVNTCPVWPTIVVRWKKNSCPLMDPDWEPAGKECVIRYPTEGEGNSRPGGQIPGPLIFPSVGDVTISGIRFEFPPHLNNGS